MGAMNDGCDSSGGTIHAIIHEMFVVDGAEYLDGKKAKTRHSLTVTTGPNLKERKEKLVENCDAIIVLPGGTGTFDELWEMTAQRALGMWKKPIVCVSIDGYYEPFREMMRRAEDDKLLHCDASALLSFASTSEEAVDLVERLIAADQGLRGGYRAVGRRRRLLAPGQFHPGAAQQAGLG